MIEEKELPNLIGCLTNLAIANPTVLDALKKHPALPGIQMVNHINDEQSIIKAVYRIERITDPQISFRIDGYHAHLITIPDYTQHKDLAELGKHLEEKIKSFNGVNPNQFAIEVEPFATQLLQYAGKKDEQGEIAGLILYKNLTGTALEDMVPVGLNTSRFEKKHFFELNKDINDTDIFEAYNLFQGRALMKFDYPLDAGNTRHWITMENGKLESYPDFDILSLVKKLPFPMHEMDRIGPDLMFRLLCGDRMKVNMFNGRKIEEFNIAADPKNKDLAIYNISGQKVSLEELYNKAPKMLNSPLVNRTPKKSNGRSI